MITFHCKNCGEPLEAPDSLVYGSLVCPRCKKPQTVPGEISIPPSRSTKIRQPAIDQWIFGIPSLLWLLWTLWTALRYCSLEVESNTLFEFYLMISAGFAWLGIILSAMLGWLCKIK